MLVNFTPDPRRSTRLKWHFLTEMKIINLARQRFRGCHYIVISLAYVLVIKLFFRRNCWIRHLWSILSSSRRYCRAPIWRILPGQNKTRKLFLSPSDIPTWCPPRSFWTKLWSVPRDWRTTRETWTRGWRIPVALPRSCCPYHRCFPWLLTPFLQRQKRRLERL